MAKQCKLIGTGNDGFRYEYNFNKCEDFKNIFSKFLLGLSFEYREVAEIFSRYDEDEKKVQEKIKDIKGSVRNYKNKNFDIDVFYGKKIISLVIRTKNKNKLIKVVDRLFKFKKER